MLYSECHQGQHHHCLHSLKFTSHFVQPISGRLLCPLCLLTQFALVVALFVIYQPSCQGVTIVSPSPPVGGTPCRLSTPVRFKSFKFFRSTYKPTTLKSISRIVHLKDSKLCGAPNSQEYHPKSSTPPPPFVGLKSIKSNKTF